jgi:HEAT repeat protein
MSITPEAIKTLLDSEDFGERIRGINELRKIETAIAYELIKPLIQDNNVRVRYAATSQLDTLGDVNREECLELIKDRLYNDPEADVRAAAADVIGGMKYTEAFKDLEEVYHSTSDWLIQFSILAALGELGNPDAFDLLAEALKSENSLLQTTAISALGELGNDDAIELLIPFATNEDWQIRHRLAQALGNLGGEKAHAILTKLQDDESNIVAEEAKHHLVS